MDLLAALGLIALCAVVVGILSGDWVTWMRGEWRRMRAEYYIDDPRSTGTMADPRCRTTIRLLGEARERMRRERIPTLLEGRPGWRKVVVAKPQRDATVLPMKRRPR